MTFNDYLKHQLTMNNCSNYLISTTNGELVESFYCCMYERGKKAATIYNDEDIHILSTEIVNDNSGKTLQITVDL